MADYDEFYHYIMNMTNLSNDVLIDKKRDSPTEERYCTRRVKCLKNILTLQRPNCAFSVFCPRDLTGQNCVFLFVVRPPVVRAGPGTPSCQRGTVKRVRAIVSAAWRVWVGRRVTEALGRVKT